jgi:iron-sulfur cluster repair protein YtfE (RIC family)
MTVNAVLRQYPRTLPILNRHGADTCRGGGASLPVAALEAAAHQGA